MTTVDEPAEVQPHLSPLMGAIFTKMFADSAATTNALLASYQAQIEALEAERYAIRCGVDELLSHPWTPSSEAVRGAVFYPDKELIDEYKANKEVGW